jgi:hypothetical protein
MKKSLLLLLSLIALGTLPGTALAQYRHYHGHVGVGVYIGPGAWYYPPPYYYPPYPPYEPAPIIVQPAAPPVYIEHNPAPAAPAPQASGDWYFCAPTNTYYPYVKECAEPWQRVAPTPPPQNSPR